VDGNPGLLATPKRAIAERDLLTRLELIKALLEEWQPRAPLHPRPLKLPTPVKNLHERHMQFAHRKQEHAYTYASADQDKD
jgi:hypothetical protein